ncbi:cuticle protein 18.6 [Ceratitis capitata]|uniref:Larval cuticle protein A2B n=1 Tax=Ceratitis capitata TaxID=7213 RepID=W8C5L6_CERCA|nr:cuticle protein 18.6 [Ceratitis capitata]
MKAIYVVSLLTIGYFINSASAGIIGHGGPIAIELEEHSPPQYEFHYSVHDSHTGDVKDQFEHRHGDYVTGRYSLIEPDGQRRVVEYNADPLLGFTAQVHRESPVIRQLPIHH